MDLEQEITRLEEELEDTTEQLDKARDYIIELEDAIENAWKAVK